jgi:hypothetical protein
VEARSGAAAEVVAPIGRPVNEAQPAAAAAEEQAAAAAGAAEVAEDVVNETKTHFPTLVSYDYENVFARPGSHHRIQPVA